MTDSHRARRQLAADTALLADHNIMDYSLYLGVHKTRFVVDGTGRGAGGPGRLVSNVAEAPSVFYLGVIDTLQEYTVAKRLERCWKGCTGREARKRGGPA